ncbi:cytochrome P450 [Tricladium varicosporioides]|nr:cytochrome P450 [Hymenoscyphus varicosporioides]
MLLQGWTAIAVYSTISFILYTIARGTLTRRQNARKAKLLHCEPPRSVQKNRLPLGIDKMFLFLRSLRNKVFPNVGRQVYFDQNSWTWEQNILGSKEMCTSDEHNIQAVLATQFADFDIGYPRRRALGPFAGNGIFLQDGKEWAHSRAMLRPQFAREQVSDLDLEELHVQNLFRVLPVAGSDGWTEEVDLQPLFSNLTLDAAADFLLGVPTNSQLLSLAPARGDPNQNNIAEFARAFEISTGGIMPRFGLGPLTHIFSFPGWAAANATCHKFVDDIVAKYLLKLKQEKAQPVESLSGKERYVFLEALAREVPDPLELRYQILNILVAGRDTTAALLGWVFFSLVRHPEAYARLRQTIINDFGTYASCDPSRDITFPKIKTSTYLQWVLNESLRLYPPVPFNSRVANKDTTIPRGGGKDGMSKVFIPKGMSVNYSVFVLQRRPDLWRGKGMGEGDEETFRPERWEGRKWGWDYVPFNGGPRICLGQQYAMTEAAYIIIRIMQRFDKMENMDETFEPKHNLGTTNSSGNGVKVKLHYV